MLKYFISILILCCSYNAFSQVADEGEEEETKMVITDSSHQLRIGFDVSKLLFNNLQSGDRKKTGYEIELDYYWRNDFYWVLEGGWGGSELSYSDLSYTSSNVFTRAGFNKSLLPRLKQDDWDMAFVGLRYGLGLIERGEAKYAISDTVWGTSGGVIAPGNFTAHWVEITGGVRVEIAKQLFIGWNARGRFLLNPKSFTELPPYYIAGYGKGEKNSIFDFNVYLSYAIRWKMKHPGAKEPRK